MLIPRYFRLIQRWFPSNNWLVKLSLFHDKMGPVWLTLKILTDALKDSKIDYALLGGLAVYKHGYQRLTNDILLAKSDVKRFEECLVGSFIRPKFQGPKRKFVCNKTKTPINISIEGEYPGKGVEIPVAFPSPETSSLLIDGITAVICIRDLPLKKYIKF